MLLIWPRFLKYHVKSTARRVIKAPSTAPPTTLPAITPALGVLLPLSADANTVSVTRTVTVSPMTDPLVEKEDTVTGAGPFLPVNRGRPDCAVVSPADVKLTYSVKVSLSAVQ